jgi:hypothetical protein
MDFVVEYWLQAIFGGMIAILGVMMRQLDAKLKQERAENEAVKTAMVAMLHDRLFQCCRYHIKNGYIPLDEAESALDNLKMLYETYAALGGNGTGTELYHRVIALPIKAE